MGATQTAPAEASVKKPGFFLLLETTSLVGLGQLHLLPRTKQKQENGDELNHQENNDYRSWIKAAFHKLGFLQARQSALKESDLFIAKPDNQPL